MTDVSIVTGGGRGIGRAIARRLARDTAVIVVGRTEADLRSACAEIAEGGGLAAFVLGDVRDRKTADEAIAVAVANGWAVRNLVCNAGVGKSGAFDTFDLSLWQEIIDVNLTGAVHFCQAGLPQMTAKGGTVCLISSVAGLKGYAYDAAYDASKHALVGLARSLAQEYGKHRISVVPVCPGFVEGEMTERTIRGVMERRGVGYKVARERVERTNPQRRIVSPEEVAEAVAFACSGKVPSLSGNPLVLSGGE